VAVSPATPPGKRLWLLTALVVLTGGWMTFDGAYALITGDFVTPSSGEYAGQLGPWAAIPRAFGLQPRSLGVKTIIAVFGVAYLVALGLFLLHLRGAWLLLVCLTGVVLLYLPFGTLAGLAVLGILVTLRSHTRAQTVSGAGHSTDNAMLLRLAETRDAEALTVLSIQLGYPTSIAETLERLRRLAERPDTHALYVAEGPAGQVVGWLHVFAALRIESHPFAEIGGLVVSQVVRGSGVGAALVAQAEAWARERGLAAIRVRSNVVRERAHRFYERAGFARLKNQIVLHKPLSPLAAQPPEERCI
jgi:GNAT superfamily N-acetyltransferase